MKKSGIIKKLVIGTPREKDFTIDDLPETRIKLFKFVLRTRLGVIMRLSLLASLFVVPLAAWDVFCVGYISTMTFGMTAIEQLSRLLPLSLLRYGTEVPLIAIGCVGLAGLLYCVRRICWGQSIKIFADFGKGIKQSWTQFVALGVLTGVVNATINYIMRFCLIAMNNDNSLALSVALAFAAVFGIMWFIAMMFAFCQSSLYETTFFRLLLNSVVLTYKRLFSSFSFCVLSVLPIAVFAVMPLVYVRIIGFAIFALFFFGFATTVQTVYCHGVFDEYINKYSYPDFVRMGMRPQPQSSDVATAQSDDKGGES